MNKKHIYIVILGLWLSPLISLASSHSFVDLQTSRGVITLELADDVAPVTVNNFLSYMHEGFYDNTLFHRVIDGFMIQGGGFSADLVLKETHEPIALELGTGLSNVRGTIAMARLSDPDTATSQFFINTVDNLHLDPLGFAVFGEVISGIDIVDVISKEPARSVVVEAVRLREGQLAFNDMQATYTTGDIIEVSLKETMTRERALNLWFAVLPADGRLLFVTEHGFSLTPDVFMTLVPKDKTSHPVFNFTVPQGLTGHFTLFAIFNNPGDGIADLNHSLRSNIAQVSFELVR